MTLTLKEEIVRSARLTETEMTLELAVALFQQDRLTLAQAASLANLPQLDFQRILGARRIPVHYEIEAMEQDVRRAAGSAPA